MTTTRTRFALFMFATVFCSFLLATGNSFAQSQYYEHFSHSAKNAQTQIDHSLWAQLLDKYVSEEDGLNLFAYGAVTAEDHQQLENYIEQLTAVTVTDLNSNEQFAYWVNLYNALTIKVILDHYPVESIRDISLTLLNRGPWKKELLAVEGIKLSLDDIEHEILRPIYRDNRIHYAVNCASVGCPNLQPVPFTSASLEDMLELAAEQYINHPRGVSIIDGELVLSSIYDWYAEDFGDEESEIIMHLIEYADDELADSLIQYDSIDDYQYNWLLNE